MVFSRHTTLSSIRIALLLALSLLVVGCGVDFVTPPVARSNPSVLAGNWAGTIEEPAGAGAVPENIKAFFLTFNNAGQITGIMSGTTDWDVTGTVEGVTGESRLFLVHLTTGGGTTIEAGLYTDGIFKHAGFIDEDLNVAVIEKNGQIPAGGYIDDDIWGSTQSRMVNIDSTFTISGTSSSTVTIDPPFPNNVTGYDDFLKDFSGTLPISDSTLGLYSGTFYTLDGAIPNDGSGILAAILSPDKTFAGSYACSPSIGFGNCGFRLWSYPNR